MDSDTNKSKPRKRVLRIFVCVLITIALYYAVFPIVARYYIVPKMDARYHMPELRAKHCLEPDITKQPVVWTPADVALTKAFLEASAVKWNDKIYYGGDSQTLKLCGAIKSQNVKKMQALIDAGADVNVKGKDGMPLLIWSLWYGKDVFECLLKNGADPNVVLESDFGRSRVVTPGCSIFYSVVLFININAPEYEVYVEFMLKYGADPNLGEKKPIFFVCCRDQMEDAFNRLLDSGADLDVFDSETKEYLLTYCFMKHRWDRVLTLLEHGASYDPETPQGARLKGLIEEEMGGYGRTRYVSQNKKDDYDKTVKWLEEHGVAFEAKKLEKKQDKTEQDKES